MDHRSADTTLLLGLLMLAIAFAAGHAWFEWRWTQDIAPHLLSMTQQMATANDRLTVLEHWVQGRGDVAPANVLERVVALAEENHKAILANQALNRNEWACLRTTLQCEEIEPVPAFVDGDAERRTERESAPLPLLPPPTALPTPGYP